MSSGTQHTALVSRAMPGGAGHKRKAGNPPPSDSSSSRPTTGTAVAPPGAASSNKRRSGSAKTKKNAPPSKQRGVSQPREVTDIDYFDVKLLKTTFNIHSSDEIYPHSRLDAASVGAWKRMGKRQREAEEKKWKEMDLETQVKHIRLVPRNGVATLAKKWSVYGDRLTKQKAKAAAAAAKKEASRQSDTLASCLKSAQVSILSVGSGDGSQQVSIVKEGHSNITTTFFDAKERVLKKYPQSGPNLSYLESCTPGRVLYGIDATGLEQYSLGEFDLVMFTFPHTGVPNNSPDNVPSNQRLLRGFLKSASKLLTPTGEIQITLKTGEPYSRWGITTLLNADFGLILRGTHLLNKALYPGYIHRLSKGANGALTVVKDDGAKVYVYGSECTSGQSRELLPPLDLSGKRVAVIALTREPLSDDEVASSVKCILRGDSGPRNVLDIRRQFDESLMPDTRQLNRVLYQMVADGALEQMGPTKKSSSKKPRWKLAQRDGKASGY